MIYDSSFQPLVDTLEIFPSKIMHLVTVDVKQSKW